MRILLVQPPSNIMSNRKEAKPALQPLGLAYIAGTLLTAGYKDVQILDCIAEGYYNETSFKDNYMRYGLSPEEIQQRIADFKPDIVGVSCICSLRRYHALEVCELAKQVNKKIITVVGGNPVTIDQKWFLEKPYVNFAILGEGEQVFLDLVRYLNKERDRIPSNGLVFKSDSEYIVRPQKEWVKDLDTIPFPAHHLLPIDKYLEIWNREGYHYYPAKKFAMMIMSRGCPNHCRHCPHDVIFKGYRARSAVNIFEEVVYLYNTLGIEEIQFHEYNGMVIWKTVEELCSLMIKSGLSKKISWGWPIGIWLKALTYDRLKLMRDAGMTYVDLAIESSDKLLLNNLMRGKDVDLNHTMQVIEWCNNLGYYINCFFMLGLEGQTKQSIEQTIEFSKSLKVDTIAYFIAQPLPGTPFWEDCKSKNLFIDGFDEFHLRYGKANIKVTGLTSEELEGYRHKAREEFMEYWKDQGKQPYDGKRGKDFLKKNIVDICGR